MSEKRRALAGQSAPGGHEACGNGIGKERLFEVQRARMLRAMVAAAAELGAGNVSVAHVVGRSGVSRRTFYEIFEDREDCFLAAFDDAIERIAAVVVLAYECPGAWRVRMRMALTALLEFFEYDPGTARLVIVETLAAGPKALEHRRSVLAQIIAVVDEGRTESMGGEGPPPLTAEGVVGAVLAVIHARVLDMEPSGSLIDLVNPLMGMIALPYLGRAATRREIQRPTPAPVAKSPVVRRDPLQGLRIRLTYRTIMVLTAVARHPGCSNRTVAGSAGIADQGQASKLLTRLQNLGLIENASGGPARGEPNAWTLTTKGWELHSAIT
jgi:AcrR family transcriptional regulator